MQWNQILHRPDTRHRYLMSCIKLDMATFIYIILTTAHRKKKWVVRFVHSQELGSISISWWIIWIDLSSTNGEVPLIIRHIDTLWKSYMDGMIKRLHKFRHEKTLGHKNVLVSRLEVFVKLRVLRIRTQHRLYVTFYLSCQMNN